MMDDSQNQTLSLKKWACEIVHEVLGEPTIHVEQITRGVMTFKFAVTVATGQRYLVRFYPHSRSSVVEYEPDLFRRCFEVGLPVPEVIVDSRTGPIAPLQYLVYKMIEGIPLSDSFATLTDSAQAGVASQIVSYIYALQQIHVTGYGDLVDATRARFESWSGFIEQAFSDGIKATKQHSLLSANIVGELEDIFENVESFLVPTTSTLTVGDISPENILINDCHRIVGLLDLENVVVGDILLNLGYSYAGQYQTRFFESLISAWPDRLTDDQWRRVKFYAILRAIRIIKFAHQPLPTGHPRMPIERFLPGFQSALADL
jgi:aminoglycoside phosphotransferase (APT) family kinase protein